MFYDHFPGKYRSVHKLTGGFCAKFYGPGAISDANRNKNRQQKHTELHISVFFRYLIGTKSAIFDNWRRRIIVMETLPNAIEAVVRGL